MARRIEITCDTCGNALGFTDARIEDCIRAEYPDRDLCQKCYQTASFLGLVTERAAVENKPVKTVIQEILKNYAD